MNNSTYVFTFVVLFLGFILKTLFEYLLEKDARMYADMDMELLKAIEEEENEK